MKPSNIQFSVLKAIFFVIVFTTCSVNSLNAQTNAPSIQSGVTFQWSDTQTVPGNSATLQSVTVNGTIYNRLGVPTGYAMTQLGPTGDAANNIRLNGGFTETTSASGTWDASALVAFDDKNLNHYFEANGNGEAICDNYTAADGIPNEATTNAQRQTLTYSPGIEVRANSLIAVTERNANNCFHIEVSGTPAGGGAVQVLGETFVNNDSTQWGYGGTGSSSSFGTPGANNPPSAGSDYWLSDRVIDNYGTIGIALFNLDDVAPVGSTITSVQLTAATADHGDGKVFIISFFDEDGDGIDDAFDLDDDDDGILDTDESGNNEPSLDEDGDGIPNWNDTTDNGTGDGSLTSYIDSNGDGVPDVYDFDGDGIPNHFDFDSDNDGCLDALEGGDAIVIGEVLVSGALDGAIDPVTGVPDNVDVTNGQTIGTSQNASAFDANGQCDSDGDGVLDATDVCQGFDDTADNDLDSIPDGCDLDDDNDGILDNVECGTDITTSNQDFEFNNTHVYTVAENNNGNAIPNSLWPTDISAGNYTTTTISDWSFIPAGNTRGIGTVYTYSSGNMTLSVIPDHESGNGGIFSTTSGQFVSGTSGNAMGFRPGDSSLDDDFSNRIVLDFAVPTHGVAFNLNDIFDQGSDPNDANTQLEIFVDGVRVLYTDMEEPFNNGLTGTKTIHGEDGTDVSLTLGQAQEFGIGLYNNTTGISNIIILYSVDGPPATAGNSESWGFDNLNWLITNCTDTDNDTIPDYLEVDSDDDGCPDAIEGAGAFTDTDLTTSNNLADADEGQVDGNGIPEDTSAVSQQQASTTAVTNNLDATACNADLSLTKTIDNATPRIGETITYTIILTNSGPSETTGVQVEDILPAGLLYDAGNSIIPVGTTYDAVTGIWDLSTVTINNGDIYTLQIAAKITPACGEITNTAQIISSAKADPDSSTNNGN